MHNLYAGLILENRYKLIKQLGEGGFAVVWEVEDLRTNGDYKAIKVCTKQSFQDVMCFRHEFWNLNDLKDLKCDQIVKVESNSLYPEEKPHSDDFMIPLQFFVMKKLTGSTLEYLILESSTTNLEPTDHRFFANVKGLVFSTLQTIYQFIFYRYPRLQPPISYLQIADWIEQLAKAIQCLHSQKIMHLDIKPKNIIITDNSNLKLIDFGASQKIDSDYLHQFDQRSVNSAYTIGYVAPEQAMKQARLHSDFYSFGYTILFALTGQHPSTLEKQNWQSQFPSELSNFLDKATQEDPLKRHSNADDLLKEAKQVARSLRRQFGRWALTNQMAAVVRIAVIATIITLALRWIGLLQTWEFAAYDQMLQMRPNLKEDPRLLIINIPNDIKDLSDEYLVKILNHLLQNKNNKPRVVGITLIRDEQSKSTPESRSALEKIYQENSNIFGICSHQDTKGKSDYAFTPETSAPIGFNNLPEDEDSKIRRQILFYQPSPVDKCKSPASFGLLITHEYLKTKHQHISTANIETYFLGNTTLFRLKPKANAYQNDRDDLLKAMSHHFQIMIDYRSVSVAKIVSSQELLAMDSSREIQEMIHDKIVLIGRTTEDRSSNKNFLPTPYGRMSGTEIIGQIISQLVSSSENQRPILRPADFLSDLTLIISTSILSAFIGWRVRHWGIKILILVIFICGLYTICLCILITEGLWLSIIPVVISIFLAISGVMLYNHYTKQEISKEL